MAKPTEKEPVDIVHQNAIHVETIMKELRHQKLNTKFNINPFKKLHVLTDKPMTGTYNKEEEDTDFLRAIHRAHLEPTKKFSHPQTEAQEIGWLSRPLLVSDRSDRRLNFPRQNSEITKYMDAAWRLKEQTQNMEFVFHHPKQAGSLSVRKTEVMKRGLFSSDVLLILLPSLLASHALTLGLGIYIGKRLASSSTSTL